MVAIIDYGMGNVASVQKAMQFLRMPSAITADPVQIRNARFIVLPGVGSFAQGMENLRARGLDAILTEEVVGNKKPFLGICLGMQLVTEHGTEPYPCKGLGWVRGKVVRIEAPGYAVPHLGWNEINIRTDRYFGGVALRDFYFIHSYHMVPEDPVVVSATVDYGLSLVAAIEADNIFATQFHPEKSQEAGLALLRNFFAVHA